MSRRDKPSWNQHVDVQAPLAAPTYLTHVTVPVFRRARAFAIAAALHLSIAAAFLAVLHRHFRALPPQEATVALILEPSPYVGSGPTILTRSARPEHHMAVHAARPAPPKPAAIRAQSSQTSPDLAAAAPHADLPLPAPPAPPAPHPLPIVKASLAAPPPPHLGNNQPAGYGRVTSAHVIPARPNSRLNLPPAYPPAALAARQEGRVLLAITVAPTGLPSAVTIVASSGFPILDSAARDAVLAWRFLPADFHGRPVASTLLLPVTFELDSQAAHLQ